MLDVEHDRTQGQWYHLETVREPSREESCANAFKTESGASHVTAVKSPSSAHAKAPSLAPTAPMPGRATKVA